MLGYQYPAGWYIGVSVPKLSVPGVSVLGYQCQDISTQGVGGCRYQSCLYPGYQYWGINAGVSILRCRYRGVSPWGQFRPPRAPSGGRPRSCCSASSSPLLHPLFGLGKLLGAHQVQLNPNKTNSASNRPSPSSAADCGFTCGSCDRLRAVVSLRGGSLGWALRTPT